MKEKDYAGTFFQNLDVHLHGFTDWTDHFHYCVGTDHFLMVAPLPGGSFRLLLSDRGEAADPSLTPQEAFLRVLSRHYDGITLGETVWHSRWETWVRLADTFREGRVFLAGDSAHVHSTVAQGAGADRITGLPLRSSEWPFIPPIVLPVYSVWAAFVVIAFPPLFDFI